MDPRRQLSSDVANRNGFMVVDSSLIRSHADNTRMALIHTSLNRGGGLTAVDLPVISRSRPVRLNQAGRPTSKSSQAARRCITAAGAAWIPPKI